MDPKRAEKLLRWVVGLLIFWDFGLAIYAVGFPHHFQEWIRFPPQPEPLFVRGVGMYWLFASWFQFLGWRNPRKYLVAIQLATWFRISAACIDTVEIMLVPKPWYFFHSMLLFFVVSNIVIAVVQASLLKKMGLKWIDWSKD